MMEHWKVLRAIYDWGDDTQKAIVLVQEDGAGGLTFTELSNVSALFDTRGPWGGAWAISMVMVSWIL